MRPTTSAPLPELSTSYAAHGAWQRDQPSPRRRLPGAGRPDNVVGVRTRHSPEHDGSDGYLDRAASVSTSRARGRRGDHPVRRGPRRGGGRAERLQPRRRRRVGVTASTKDHPSPNRSSATSSTRSRSSSSSMPPTRSLRSTIWPSALVARVLPHRTQPFADIVRQSASSTVGRCPTSPHAGLRASRPRTIRRHRGRASDHRRPARR